MSVYAIGEHHLTEEELTKSKFELKLEDILYIRLDPLEAKLQQLQDRRIFDNQYLFSITPAARRWYELMAATIFGVVTNKGKFCEIRYSWYVQHHHTLKRQYQRFRVVEQMDRVIRDHVESGYIAKVEYRAIRELDQEIDYVIRYYPGPGAAASMDRIQTHIRQPRLPRRSLTDLQPAKQGSELTSSAEQRPPLSLSVVTADHENLILELVLRFGIAASKAYELALTRKEAVRFQLEVWPLRGITPRNRAGWMIGAIDRNYEAPAAYFEQSQQRDARQQRDTVQAAVRRCDLCDASGFRHIQSAQYPTGAMRLCSHDQAVEARYNDTLPKRGTSPNAKNWPLRGSNSDNGEKPA